MTFQTIVGQHFQFFWYIYNRCGDSFDSEWLSTPIPVGATGGEWVWSGCAHFWTHSSADHWRGQFSHARISPISTNHWYMIYMIHICAAEHCAQFTATSPHPIFSYSPPQEPKKTAIAKSRGSGGLYWYWHAGWCTHNIGTLGVAHAIAANITHHLHLTIK